MLLLHIIDRNRTIMHEEIYRQILRQHAAEVLGFIRRIVPQRQDAEELAQDTFIKAFRSLDSYDSRRGNMRPWLLRIAYREALMHLRQQARTLYMEEIDGAGRLQVSDDEAERMLADIREERIQMLEEAVRRLPPEDQTLLHLYYNNRWRLQQIGEVMERDAAYLATRLQRIRKKLCVMIKTIEDNEDE